MFLSYNFVLVVFLINSKGKKEENRYICKLWFPINKLPQKKMHQSLNFLVPIHYATIAELIKDEANRKVNLKWFFPSSSL